jgi:excisionase family DNA binding protein
MNDYLSPSEAASYLGISTSCLRKWSAKGIVRSYRYGKRGRRFYKREELPVPTASPS